MKRLLISSCIVAHLCLALAGCGCGRTEEQDDDAKSNEPGQEQPAGPVDDLVDTVTGAKQIRKGKEAEQQIRNLEEEHRKKLDEVLDM